MMAERTLLLGLGVGLGLGISIGLALRATAPPGTPKKCSAKAKKEAAEALPPATARVSIEYCTGCRWLMRAGWTAQELLTTFQDQLLEVSLLPNNKRPGGAFEIRVNGEMVYSRREMKRFPEMKELKQLVRNVIAPEKDLGHSDKPAISK
jgi:selenoprotein W-related protein